MQRFECNEKKVWRAMSCSATGALAALVAASYCALILAQAGVFRLWPCLVVFAGTGFLTAWIASRNYVPLSRNEKIGWCLAAVLALGTLFVTVPPDEMILGGWDPGVYVHTAAAVANHGSLRISAGDIALIPDDVKQGLTREIAGWKHPFLGMFPLPDGSLSPQFMHLYPSLMAVGYAVGGIWGALSVNPILNVIAILAVFWLASKLVGPGWAVVAALLMAINPAQVWQARFSTAEMLTQVLLLTGFCALLKFTRYHGSIMAAAVAGALFGLAFFARYDVILIVVPLALLLIVLRNEPWFLRGVLAFLLALGVVGMHAAAHMTFVAPCYRPLPGLVFPLLMLAAGGGILLLIGMRFDLGRRMASLPFKYSRLSRALLSLGFVACMVFAWYVRPRLMVDGRVRHVVNAFLSAVGRPEWIHGLAGGDNAYNIEYLAAIFGVAGLFMALAGIVTLIWRVSDRGAAIWLLASVANMMLFVMNIFHDHFMMWVSRRFVPVVIPLLVIAIAAMGKEIYRLIGIRYRSLALPVAAGLLAALTLTIIPQTSAMAAVRNWPGLVAWYDNLARDIPADAVVFCDQPGFAAPLRFLYGINAHEVYGETAAGFVSRNRSYLAGLNSTIGILSMRDQNTAPFIELHGIGEHTLYSHIQEHTKYSIPNAARGRSGYFALYAVGFREAAEFGSDADE